MELEELKKAMSTGEIYYETSELWKEQQIYNEYNYQYNQLSPTDDTKKRECLKKLFGSVGKEVTISQPVHANWGKNTFFGD